MNPTSVVNTFNPYYFPWVVGSGQNVKGYFDYRPKDINEAVVEAISANAGQTWTFQQMAEQLTTECPNSDSNTANDSPGGNPAGNDNGEGHPSVISYGGSTILYTLNRVDASRGFRRPDRAPDSPARRQRAEPSPGKQPVHAAADVPT